MVGMDSALRRLTRDAGKLLLPYGFEGSEGLWLREVPGGLASVGRTRTQRTWTDGQQVLRFGLCLSATPLAWWEFRNWRNEQSGLAPVPIERASGPGLLTERGLPANLTEQWSLRVDPDLPGGHALQADVDTIRAELPKRVHTYARRALRLLEPDGYLDELLADPDPQFATREAIVVLLADRGPGPELDDAVTRLRACRVDPDTSNYVETLIEYAQGRAALV
ncbi:hypothetical protein ACFYO1_33200 [Nocardia sp. NPDC006044]|uniref:hypothetical protein n=1 Tax=Nocardia sp. NPDC006044 TaxID=3364306 RepID=UPI0036A9FE71